MMSTVEHVIPEFPLRLPDHSYRAAVANSLKAAILGMRREQLADGGAPCLIDPTGGDAAPALVTDQRGAARLFGSTADIGAIETFNVHVDHLATGNDDGTTWTDSYLFLQDALTSTGDLRPLGIYVAQGTGCVRTERGWPRRGGCRIVPCAESTATATGCELGRDGVVPE